MKTTTQKIIWGKTSKEILNWKDAKEWCEKQGGRLPTICELLQAFNDGIKGFKNLRYWSATGYRKNTNGAWNMFFNDGCVDYNYKDTGLAYARYIIDSKKIKKK